MADSEATWAYILGPNSCGNSFDNCDIMDFQIHGSCAKDLDPRYSNPCRCFNINAGINEGKNLIAKLVHVLN